MGKKREVSIDNDNHLNNYLNDLKFLKSLNNLWPIEDVHRYFNICCWTSAIFNILMILCTTVLLLHSLTLMEAHRAVYNQKVVYHLNLSI